MSEFMRLQNVNYAFKATDFLYGLSMLYHKNIQQKPIEFKLKNTCT